MGRPIDRRGDKIVRAIWHDDDLGRVDETVEDPAQTFAEHNDPVCPAKHPSTKRLQPPWPRLVTVAEAAAVQVNNQSPSRDPRLYEKEAIPENTQLVFCKRRIDKARSVSNQRDQKSHGA